MRIVAVMRNFSELERGRAAETVLQVPGLFNGDSGSFRGALAVSGSPSTAIIN